MNLDREVGEIKTQVRFMTQDIHEIKADVKSLLAFRWKVYGGAIVLSILMQVIFHIAEVIAKV